MKRNTIVLLLLVLLVRSLHLRGQVQEIKINPEKTFQTIENFAAADAWSGHFVGKYWAEKEKRQVAEWLFSTDADEKGQPKGIGLSLWRVNTGAGTLEQADADIMPIQRRAESFLTEDGKSYDWSKASGQQYFMEQAARLGCNNFLLFSNSPLVQYTLNGKGWSSANNAANLKSDHYGKYAEYLADVASYFQNKGWNISYISPINEPQVKWDSPRQEGSPWKKGEIKKLFSLLDSALSEKQDLKHVKMLLGETANLKVLYEKDEALRTRFGGADAPDEQVWAYFDTKSPYYIGNLKHLPRMIAGHSYHNHKSNEELREVRSNVGKIVKHYKIDFHQSEWCLLPNYVPPMDGFTSDWVAGNRGDIQTGLLMGRLIYSDFVDANSIAWGYWKGMELKGDHALVALHAKDNDIFKGGTVSSNKILWALGNYSLFIRPGYKRIDTQGADDLDTLAASSFISPDGRRMVSVFVNSSFEAKDIRLKLTGKFRRGVSNVMAYHTDEKSDLEPAVLEPKSQIKHSIPARSLVTIVLDLKK